MRLQWETVEIIRCAGNHISGLDKLRALEGRYVYVIETPRPLAIRYEAAISNVCYIGRQGDRLNGDRLRAHGKNWITKFLILSQSDAPFRVHYCHPRRRNFATAYADIEALLIRVFTEHYGNPPLFNRRSERETGEFDVVINAPFLVGRPADGPYTIDARKGVDPAATEGA